MPDIFKAWRWFVALLTLGVIGIFSLPKGCALRPSDEFVEGLVDRAVDRAVEKLEADMEEYDATQWEVDSDVMENGYEIPSSPLDDEE